MSPNGLLKGKCASWFSLLKEMGRKSYLPDPSHFLSPIALNLPYRDLTPSYSQVVLPNFCSSCSGS